MYFDVEGVWITLGYWQRGGGGVINISWYDRFYIPAEMNTGNTDSCLAVHMQYKPAFREGSVCPGGERCVTERTLCIFCVLYKKKNNFNQHSIFEQTAGVGMPRCRTSHVGPDGGGEGGGGMSFHTYMSLT